MDADKEDVLEEHHRHLERLKSGQQQSYLGDAILGAIDGAVTTFAIVSGAVGGGLSSGVIILLGFANLVADGFSMAVSNYEGTKSEEDRLQNVRDLIQRHIQEIPEHAREQVRQVFEDKGLHGETLENTVEKITENPERWEKTLIQERWGMTLGTPNAYYSGGITFLSFLAAGLIPLSAFLVPELVAGRTFFVSSIMTGITFVAIGVLKGNVLNRSTIQSGLSTLFSGGGAAVLAYAIGSFLRGYAGV